ncbi:MAG: hypothetical protein WCW64_00615 [Phycisphaerae bacterium]
MAKKKHSAAIPIKEGIFPPEDFTKLHQDYVIYIKEGVLIDLKKL